MKRKNKDEQITKSYEVKFKNAQQVFLVYSVMDSLGISGAYVSKYSHSKMDEYKKQIKINAIKAARDKANYLLEAISEKAGKAVSVTEVSGYVIVDDGSNTNRYDNYNSRMLGNSLSQTYGHTEEDKSNVESGVAEKTIKLHYDINAEFEIQ